MRSSNQKLKLLFLMKILLEKTDEEHTLTVPQMIAELEKLGVSSERKSIYDDLEYLKLFGLDICSRKSRTNDYFVASHDFELPELKLLVDSVSSSKFITRKKSMELISKIEKLTSVYNAKKLQRQVFVTNRVKTFNEKIYYNVDKIHIAIAENRQIAFKYFDIDVNKNKIYRKNGKNYIESPVALSWDDENYYLIVYKKKYDNYAHYRVDKMESIELVESERDLLDEQFDLSAYSKKIFQMYGGEETDVSIIFENDLVGVVYDKFGLDVPVIKTDDNHFVCNVKVAVSPHFLSWVISFGNKAKIIHPKSVALKLRDMADNAISNYK